MKTKTSKATPYFTRDLLIEASKLGLKWNYNRQISEQIAEVSDLKYQVLMHMPHHHRRFVPCEEHIRCMISLEPFKDTVVFCDVPIDFFLKLPQTSRNKLRRQKVGCVTSTR